MISAENRSRLWTEEVGAKYPSHSQKKQKKFVQQINKEIPKHERKQANQQFRTNYQTGMTQKQQKAARQKLHEKGRSSVLVNIVSIILRLHII